MGFTASNSSCLWMWVLMKRMLWIVFSTAKGSFRDWTAWKQDVHTHISHEYINIWIKKRIITFYSVNINSKHKVNTYTFVFRSRIPPKLLICLCQQYFYDLLPYFNWNIYSYLSIFQSIYLCQSSSNIAFNVFTWAVPAISFWKPEKIESRWFLNMKRTVQSLNGIQVGQKSNMRSTS